MGDQVLVMRARNLGTNDIGEAPRQALAQVLRRILVRLPKAVEVAASG
jgi:hypothetical protein